MQAPVVLLDACTLYPTALRDVLMRLSLHGLILARWTDAIHHEWIEAVLRDRPDPSRAQLERTRQLMNLHAEDSLVTGHEKRIGKLVLPDTDDRHVLAAAIEAGAYVLLTWHLRDFPQAAMAAHGITAKTPDTLLVRLCEPPGGQTRPERPAWTDGAARSAQRRTDQRGGGQKSC